MRFAAFLLAILVMIGSIEYGAAQDVPPDPEVMRAYRVSKLTDDQLRALIQKAKQMATELAASVNQNAPSDAAQEQTNAELRAQCANDPVFKLRHYADCEHGYGFRPTMHFGQNQTVSPMDESDFVDLMLFGDCYTAKTVGEARQRDCLPPN